MNNRPLTKAEVDAIYKRFDRMLYSMPGTTDCLYEISMVDEQLAENMLQGYRMMFLMGYVNALQVDNE